MTDGYTSSPRQATDVLLSIESHLVKLVKTMSTYDLTNKLILDKVNKIHTYIDKLEKELVDYEKIQQKDLATTATTNNTSPLEIDQNPIGTRRVSRVETQAIETSSILDGNITDKPSTNEKKVPVIQRITDQHGKDLFMADVSILNENKEVVAKVKTNAMGKWQAHIKPGKYVVHTVKTDSATKSKIEALQDIIVPSISSIYTLPVAIIKRS